MIRLIEQELFPQEVSGLPETSIDLRRRETATTTLDYEVVRSTKRKKSSQASLAKGVVTIRIPSWFSQELEKETVDYFIAKFERQRSTDRFDLIERAALLSKRYAYLEATSICWVSNQQQQWGSCTPHHGSVRLSDRLAAYPDWVIDYVICHELAHLSEPNHSQQFWNLVYRYPRTERARGFLLAKGMGDDD